MEKDKQISIVELLRPGREMVREAMDEFEQSTEYKNFIREIERSAKEVFEPWDSHKWKDFPAMKYIGNKDYEQEN